MKNVAKMYLKIALPLLGSAILLYSCDDGGDAAQAVNEESLMTEQSENLSIVMSENGRKSYFFRTPLLEGYMLARDPYREFRKGIEITTYQDDSLSTVNAVLTANYAIYYENRKLWEAKGDVVVVKADGTQLYTQQLFWNSMTKRIYSNVDTKVVKNTDVFYGEGFESDEEIKQWKFRRMTGRMFVKINPEEDDDESSSAAEKPEEPEVKTLPAQSEKPVTAVPPQTESRPKSTSTTEMRSSAAPVRELHARPEAERQADDGGKARPMRFETPTKIADTEML